MTDMATVVAVLFHVDGLDDGAELSIIVDQAAERADELAAASGIERVLAGADRYLFIAGLGQPTDGLDEAIDFASGLARMLHGFETDHDGVEVGPRIGVATGMVATGMLQESNLCFGAWGEPVHQALAGSLATSDEVLIDTSSADVVDPARHHLVAADDVVDPSPRPRRSDPCRGGCSGGWLTPTIAR